MFAMFKSLSEMEMIFICLIAAVLLFLGYKLGSFFSSGKYKKQIIDLEKECHNSSKSLKKIMEEEKEGVSRENAELKENNKMLSDKLEDYRKKVSGMGLLSFGGSKKRSDILYSLLMENEALEQLLLEQGEKLVDERQDFLRQKLQDIRKRQRLMAEIFNDDTIKNYVKDVLSDGERLKSASDKVDAIGNEEEVKKIT